MSTYFVPNSNEQFTEFHLLEQTPNTEKPEFGVCEKCFEGLSIFGNPVHLNYVFEDGKTLGICDRCNHHCIFCQKNKAVIDFNTAGKTYGICQHCLHIYQGNPGKQSISIHVTESGVDFYSKCECGEHLERYNYGKCDGCGSEANRIPAHSQTLCESIFVCTSCTSNYYNRQDEVEAEMAEIYEQV